VDQQTLTAKIQTTAEAALAHICIHKEYPPRQKAASFTIDEVLQALQPPHGST